MKICSLSIFLIVVVIFSSLMFVNSLSVAPTGYPCDKNSNCLTYSNHENDGCYWRTMTCQDCGKGACASNDNLCFRNSEINTRTNQLCYNGIWVLVDTTTTTTTIPPTQSLACTILPVESKEEENPFPNYYIGDYELGNGAALAKCNINPTLGESGCDCAEKWCKYWCGKNVCDWKLENPLRVTRAVCNEPELMPHCNSPYICPPTAECIATDTSKDYPSGDNPFVKGWTFCPNGECEDKCEKDGKTLRECSCPKTYGSCYDTSINCDHWMTGRCRDDACYCAGNMNPDKDDIINILDIGIMARAFGSKSGDPNWNSKADVNGDGVVNIKDITIMASAFGRNCKDTTKIPMTGPRPPSFSYTGRLVLVSQTYNIIIALTALIVLISLFGVIKTFSEK